MREVPDRAGGSRQALAVIVPYGKKALHGTLRRQIGVIDRELCRQGRIVLIERRAMLDPLHRCLGIPPKCSVAHTIGLPKGESVARIHPELLYERRVTGLHFWSVGYSASTVGRDEATVRQYIRSRVS